MSVRWVWVFLDLPEHGFEEAVEFWRAVTQTSVSPWRGERGQFATLVPEHGDPVGEVQRVGGAGGIHLDLDAYLPLAAARDVAVSLRGVVLDEVLDGDGLLQVVVCRSPGGYLFCLTSGAPQETARGQLRVGQPSLLDQVCLDIPHRPVCRGAGVLVGAHRMGRAGGGALPGVRAARLAAWAAPALPRPAARRAVRTGAGPRGPGL